MLLNRSVQGDNRVTSLIFATRETNVSYNANQPTARDQRRVTLIPDLVELLQKLFVVSDVA